MLPINNLGEIRNKNFTCRAGWYYAKSHLSANKAQTFIIHRRSLMAWLWFSIFGYVLGSIPFGKILSSVVYGIDISSRGSGNIGATNVSRELGLGWGVVTLILDMAKGWIPVLAYLSYISTDQDSWALSFVAVAPVLGHQFSIFSGLKGGKGVATSLGVWLPLNPAAVITSLIPFIVCVAVWRYISIGSMALSITVPLLHYLWGEEAAIFTASVFMALLILYKHKSNIARILKGDEPRWKWNTQRKS